VTTPQPPGPSLRRKRPRPADRPLILCRRCREHIADAAAQAGDWDLYDRVTVWHEDLAAALTLRIVTDLRNFPPGEDATWDWPGGAVNVPCADHRRESHPQPLTRTRSVTRLFL